MGMEQLWNDTVTVELKRDLSQSHFTHNKSHSDWSGIESGVSVVRARRLTEWDKGQSQLSKGFIKRQLVSKLEEKSRYSSAHGKLDARKWPRIIDGSEQTCFTISNNTHAIRGAPYPELSWWVLRKCRGMSRHVASCGLQEESASDKTLGRTILRHVFTDCVSSLKRSTRLTYTF